MLGVTGLSPAPSALATGVCHLKQLHYSELQTRVDFAAPLVARLALANTLPSALPFLPPFILFLKVNFVFPFNNQSWQQGCRAERVASPCTAGLFAHPRPSLRVLSPGEGGEGGRDALGVLQGEGQPRSSASLLPRCVLHAPGARQHLGTATATAELRERQEDGCQKGVLSTEAWGTGLLLLMAPGLAEQGRIPRRVCIQT